LRPPAGRGLRRLAPPPRALASLGSCCSYHPSASHITRARPDRALPRAARGAPAETGAAAALNERQGEPPFSRTTRAALA
jgi:hypothetical protein